MSEYKNRTRYNSIRGEIPGEEIVYPNWIVTDVRFPNEADAIKNRGGILIRINRNSLSKDKIKNAIEKTNGYLPAEHESETALDNYNKFDYIVENNSSIEELINKINNILKNEKLVKEN
jgi:hypothetical protein